MPERSALLEVNNAIIANLDREELLDAISDALRTVVEFDRASLTLLDPDTGLLEVTAVVRPRASPEMVAVGTEFPKKGSHLERVLEERRPLVCDDLSREERTDVEDRLLQEGIRSYVSVPLLGKRGVAGMLNVGSRQPHAYARSDGDFLLAVAEQMALAVENMKAYEEIAELKARLERENVYLQEEIETRHGFERIVGESHALRRVLKAVETVAPTGATVLVSGETGTGKELVARAIHELSPREAEPLVKVNCAALPSNLIESELFGHAKGAFTGAVSRTLGRFELADGGTIVLDEVGELPPELQPKLLRVLEDGEFQRVGGERTIAVDVRVIAATNRDLERAVEEGGFRPDLYYRLNVFPIRVPPLRERREDIPLLVRHFVDKHAGRTGRTIESIPTAAMDRLMAYDWPGNVRELENVIERAVIVSPGPELVLPNRLMPHGGSDRSRFPTMHEMQIEHIRAALDRTGGVVSGPSGAARLLGMKSTTLFSRMKKLGIERDPD